MVLANTVIAVIGVIAMIVILRLNPIISLTIGGMYLGLVGGLGPVDTLVSLTTGFGDILAEVGLLIAFGVLTGELLYRLGAIQRLSSALQRLVGAKRLPYATGLLTGTVMQSIFIDVMVVITAPMVNRVGRSIGRNGLPRMISALSIGSIAGLVLVVPGVALVSIVGVLDASLGKTMIFGLIVAVPTILLSIFIMDVLFTRLGWWNPEKDEIKHSSAIAGETAGDGNASIRGTSTTGQNQSDHLPLIIESETDGTGKKVAVRNLPLLIMYLPLLAGLLLISVGGISDLFGDPGPTVGFVSNPLVALFIALVGTAIVALICRGRDALDEIISEGFKNSGQILVLTGIAGSFAKVITDVGIGDVLGNYLRANSVYPVLMVWAMAALIHVLIGTVTISAIMSIGVIAPVAASMGIDPSIIALAAGSGSIFAVHITSNTFWQFQSLFGQSVRGTLKTYTVAVSVASVVSLLLILALSAVVS